MCIRDRKTLAAEHSNKYRKKAVSTPEPTEPVPDRYPAVALQLDAPTREGQEVEHGEDEMNSSFPEDQVAGVPLGIARPAVARSFAEYDLSNGKSPDQHRVGATLPDMDHCGGGGGNGTRR